MRALFPVGEVLGQAAAPLPTVRRMSEDLDEAEHLRDAPEEAETGALGCARWVRVVTDVGPLGAPRDGVLDRGGARGGEGALADVLGEIIVGVVHGETAQPSRRRDPLSPFPERPAALPWAHRVPSSYA